jgi:hypothetical protein
MWRGKEKKEGNISGRKDFIGTWAGWLNNILLENDVENPSPQSYPQQRDRFFLGSREEIKYL